MPSKTCAYWDCDESISARYTVCRDHYAEFSDDLLDECPDCGRLKSIQYDQCMDCYRGIGPKKKPRGLLSRVADAISEAVDDAPAPSAKRSTRTKKRTSKTPARSTAKTAPKMGHDQWRDSETDVFYIYLLELESDGKIDYYAGQSNDIRARMREHRRGQTPSTAGKNPKLVWFTRQRTRKEAQDYETYLHELINSNERAVTRMIIDFQDVVGELDTSS